MMNQRHHELFALIVEYVARELPSDDQWKQAYVEVLTDIVVDAGGTMDNVEFVTQVQDMLSDIIAKNAAERRQYLDAQAA